MTDNINKLFRDYLQDQGYNGKSVNDLVRRALRWEASSSRNNLNDLWKDYLEKKGYTGSINDMIHSWLGDKGYFGSLDDRWQQALKSKDFFSSTPLIDDLTLSRPSAAWAWGSDQLLDEYAADELRRDYDPATGAFRGVLVEESRTNQLLDNRDLSTGNWSSSASVTQDQTGIDGVANAAWTVEDTSSSEAQIKDQSFGVADDSEVYTASVFIKKETSSSANNQLSLRLNGGTTERAYTAEIDSVNGTVTAREDSAASDVSIQDKGEFWFVSVSGANNGTGNTILRVFIFPASFVDGSFDSSGQGSLVYDFGKIEKGAVTISSPIETDGTATTRAADVLEGPFSESSGTLHFVGEHKGGDGVLWQADDGTEDNRVRLEVSSGDILLTVNDGGASQASLNAGSLASDGTYNAAFRFDNSDFAVSLDGSTPVTTSSGTMPSVSTQRFGRDTSSIGGINWYKTTTYLQEKLSNAELESLAS